ncbi:UDP-N-acetylmuramate--alanine ligase [Rubidibacter lacunae KORDI 51-2]|uniref:UDP-N-acetylmuramate--L-alanine ligase n=1 Tax=Rubidibacter lacunae KORDI 51-2 TaxID=582515 RepID=U5D9B7_9CHRO|nr:UDP-N-acetylmuramate--L-alanine ligase [Rubidibacter lacunae]ERN41178.1 UDP-N-acetylmuramate--alanine ligase [Rubidibacter lacunae KORDI 51-2]
MSNLQSVDLSGQPFHFIGVGGIGMSALAYVLAKRQLPVSGSDLRLTHITQRLHAAGAHIFSQQAAKNLEYFSTPSAVESKSSDDQTTDSIQHQQTPAIAMVTPPSKGLPQVICSTAITKENCEYAAAVRQGCKIFHRSDLLAALMSESPRGIAVAGTHGKTTTSSALAYVLLEAGLDPTIVVGGEVDAWDGNAHLGGGEILVAEADESDGSLIKMVPHIGIVTNIELDHPDYFTSLDAVMNIFRTFARQCPTLVGCIDWQTVVDLKPDITYSLDPDRNADYTVTEASYHSWGSTAVVWEYGQSLGPLRLQLLGPHNLSNALAVVATARSLNVEFAAIARGLERFTGTKRRFEIRGEVAGVTLVDDYAHHPSEVRATLAAARLCQVSALTATNRARRVLAIFQPHRYSRTEAFLDEFATSFADADIVITTDIYSAGEPARAICGQTVADAIAAHHPQVHYQPDLEALSVFLVQLLQPGDLVLYLGAGNLNQTIPKAIALLGGDREAA